MSGWTEKHSARPDEDVGRAELRERRPGPRRTRARVVAIVLSLLGGGLGGLALYIILEGL